MIRNRYNQTPPPALKTEREIKKYIKWQQFTKGTRFKPNEQLFPKQVVIQLPKIYKTRHLHLLMVSGTEGTSSLANKWSIILWQ